MPRSSRAGLTRERVIQVAARLVNAEGAEALTVSRLARELGVKPPSLYNHIESLADLRYELALLSTNALGDRIVKAAVGRSGPEGIRALAQAYRAYIQEFPGLYQASLPASRNLESPDNRLREAEDRVVRVALAVIQSFQMPEEEAIHAARALRSLVHGFGTLEMAGGFGLPLSLNDSFERMVEILIHGMERTELD